MLGQLFQYLLESSLYLATFLIVYRWLISNQTHFAWMRGYLLMITSLSIILPLVIIPDSLKLSITGHASFFNPLSLAEMNVMNPISNGGIMSNLSSNNGLSLGTYVLNIIALIYFIGVSIKLFILAKNLLEIRQMVRTNKKTREGDFWIINIRNGAPAFSFLKYIFLNTESYKLSEEDTLHIKNHELIHCRQLHSVDTIFIELVSVVLWFNPAIRYLKTSIQGVHEFLADEHMNRGSVSRKYYSGLLLNLSSNIKIAGLYSGFSSKEIVRRIKMLSKSKSPRYYRMFFLLVIPIATTLMLSFSYFDNCQNQVIIQEKELTQEQSFIIGSINWEGNTIYSDRRLTRKLGIKNGDVCSKELIDKNLCIKKDAVSHLYLDNGYLFFQAQLIIEPTEKETQNITIQMTEGFRTRVGEVSIKGNNKVPTEDIIKKIKIKPGDWFDRSKIMKSIRSISTMEKFDPEEIYPKIIPKQQLNGEYIVHIEFEVKEI